VLGEAHDLGSLARLEVCEGEELRVLLLLELRLHGPAVRAAFRAPEALVYPFDHLLGEGVAELVGVHVRLGGGVAHEVGEEALDDAVLADDPLRSLDPRLGENCLLLVSALDEPVHLEAFQHLPRGRARDAQHLGDACSDRGRSRGRPVLPDREGQEVDRLEVVVDRMSLRPCHAAPSV